MLPHEVDSHIKKLDAKIEAIDSTLAAINDHCTFENMSKMQNVASNYIVIASTGLVETGLRSILKEYCSPRCSPQLKQYLEFNLERHTTMNCKKIKTLLGAFDASWAETFHNSIEDEQRIAIDSIKSLRDEIAHGRHNGTRLNKVKDYYEHSKATLKLLSNVIKSH